MRFLIARMVRLYPDSLRREFGDEMADVLFERYRECRARGVLAAVHEFWLRETAAILRARRTETFAPSGAGSGWNDAKVSLRALRTSPGFTIAAVLLLGLGVGSSTAVFSVTEAVVLAPLPFERPQELMLLFETNPERGWVNAQVAPANFLDWRSESRTFQSLTASNDFLLHSVLDGDEPARVRVSRVFGNFFEVLGAPLLAGRGFTDEETWTGSDKVVVLSEAFWRSRFGADPAVIGSEIRLEGESHIVIGVASASLRYPFESTDLWLPFGWDPAARAEVSFRRAHSLRVVGRLLDGVGIEDARSELQSIAQVLERDYPETNEQMGVDLKPLHDWIVGDVRTPLLLMNISVVIVLLVACANVSSLILVRWSQRDREMSLRTALGAGCLSLVRLATIESALVASAGGVLGVALAYWGVPILARMAPSNVPRLDDVGMDLAVVAFAIVATVATALLCGMLPALRATRARVAQPLKDGARRTDSFFAGRLLVAVEVALAVMLSIGAVLLVRSFENLRRIDPGFNLENVASATMRLPGHRYAEPEDGIRFARLLLERLPSHPGVVGASLAGRDLLNAGWTSDFTAADWGAERYGVGVLHRQVAPDYFKLLGIPLLAGRAFTDEDGLDTPAVVLVNKALADEFFPREDPIGKRVCYDRTPDESSYWRTIVGVVGNERNAGLMTPPRPMFIEPIYQGEVGRTLFLLVRTRSTPSSIAPMLRRVVAEIDPAIPIYDVELGEALLGASLNRERFLLTLMSLFALFALVLTVAGIYSVLSFTVSQRRREIGVRMALGARAGVIMRLVVKRGLALAAVGIATGIAGALISGRLVSSLLYGVEPTDPVALGIVATVVVGAAVAASLAPAARAARTDPAQSVRSE